LIWTLSETQAVPRNWFKVEVNQKKINWMANGSNYIDVLSLAIDEAAGHGFATEFAGELNMEGWLYKEGQYDTEAMKGLSVSAFLDQIQSQGFPRDTQLLDLMKKHIPMPPVEDLPPQCQDENSFYNWNIYECVGYMPADWTFDSDAFANDLEERVVQPMKDAQEILDRHDYVTRLYSTVSPDEMNRDPMFHFNADLPDVSNEHIAEATATCNEDGSVSDVVITLESGESFTLEADLSNGWWGWMSDEEYGDPAPDEGAAASISLVGADGEPVEIAPSDVKTIDARLDDEDPSVVLADLMNGIIDGAGTPAAPTDPTDPTDPAAPTDPADPADPDTSVGPEDADTPASGGGGDDGGCGGAGGSAPLWPALVALMLLAAPRSRWS
ncbi:MAG: hypothetical protein VX938_05685, partial [Myxococcota bacterium]|nr:hypothetical protein [Myxococcota bacterium]